MEPKFGMVRENSVCDGATATCGCGIDDNNSYHPEKDCKCQDCGTCGKMVITKIPEGMIIFDGYLVKCPKVVPHSHDGRTLCAGS